MPYFPPLLQNPDDTVPSSIPCTCACTQVARRRSTADPTEIEQQNKAHGKYVVRIVIYSESFRMYIQSGLFGSDMCNILY